MNSPIAIIPARGGSKRIPRKNIKEFAGLPLIAHSLKVLRATSLFQTIAVSTDDDEIANIALDYGATNIIWRSDALSNDTATTLAVMRDVVNQLQLDDEKAVCCAYATAPLMQSQHIIQAYDTLLKESVAGHVFPACHFDFPIHRGFYYSDTKLTMMFPEHQLTRSQDLPEVLHDAGQFYWAKASCWKSEQGVFTSQSRALQISRKYVQDIDTPEDWEIAEILHKLLQRR